MLLKNVLVIISKIGLILFRMSGFVLRICFSLASDLPEEGNSSSLPKKRSCKSQKKDGQSQPQGSGSQPPQPGSENQKRSQAREDFKSGGLNKYLDFIKECREKEQNYSSEQLNSLSYHHIVPRHHYKKYNLDMGTFEAPENKVKVTFEDHITAHELRFEVYGERGDQAAFLRMKGHQEEGMRAMQQAGGQAANVLFKERGMLMHDPEFQKEMARRSLERPDALQIRSAGGKRGNFIRHQNVTVRVEDRIEWSYKKRPYLCTFGFDNGGDLLRALNEAIPTKLKRVSPLVKGDRQSASGWSCKKLESSVPESSENSSETEE